MIGILKYYVLVCLLSFCCFSVVNGQKENSIWYFGDNAGIDFNQGFPVPLIDGAMNTWEGCATISDSTGNLLFYTDGVYVWNKKHKLMPNGNYLLGDPSSSQSSIIVPHPGQEGIYYLFTVPDDRGKAGLRYSIIDMTLDNGLGDIDILNKNIAILPEKTLVTEKLTAVKQSDNKSYWVITHEYGSNRFFSISIDSTGINEDYLISDVGSKHDAQGSVMGYMKASPKGNRVAVAVQTMYIIEVFDFNNTTGELSNPVLISDITEENTYYGVEFSPNEEFLYASQRKSNTIFQWDLNEEDVLGSRMIIGETLTPAGALQTGPDGSIYLASQGNTFLHIIQMPNRKGKKCNFQQNALFLNGRKSREGLPNFIASFDTESTFLVKNLCINDTTFFSIINKGFIDSLLWDFGDIEGPAPIFTTIIQDTSYIYPASGSYDVTMIAAFIDGKIDTIKQSIYVSDYPVPMLGKDTSFCEGTPLTLDAGGNNDCLYLWNNYSTGQYLNITESDNYSVMVSMNGCVSRDTIFVDIIPGPKILNKTTLESDCNNNTGEIHLETDGGQGEYSFLWNTNPQLTQRDITNIEAGLYIVTITDNNTTCTLQDTTIINNPNGPDINIQASKNPACFGDTISLTAHNAAKYEWENGNSLSQIEFIASESRSIWVKGTDEEGCSSIEKKYLIVNPNPEIYLDDSYEPCFGNEIILDPGGEYNNYVWNNGSQSSSIIVKKSGQYSVTVTNNYGCASTAETTVDFKYSPIFDLGRDTIICEGSSVTLSTGNWYRYNWSTGESESEITVTETDNYFVRVTGQNGCQGSDEIYVQVNDPENLLIDNIEVFDVKCGKESDGIIKILGHGSSGPLLYSIDDGQTYYNNSGIFRDLSANVAYSVAIKEQGACIRKGQSYTLTEPNVLNAYFTKLQPSCPLCSDGNISITVNGGTAPYSYQWSDFDENNMLVDIPLGTYSVKITDINNCIKTYSTELIFGENPFLNIPNVFTPNNDGINDLWQIAHIEHYTNTIIIVYNSNGKKVYESAPGYPVPWNGTFNGKSLPTDSYYYIIDTKKGDEVLKGSVTIIK